MSLKKELWMKYHLNFPIEGGHGENYADAVRILLTNNLGILLEKDIIACMFCNADYSFDLLKQRTLKQDDKQYDYLKVKLNDGEIKEVFFDISEFFGKSLFKYYSRNGSEYAALLKQMTIRPSSEEEQGWFE